MRAGLTVGSLFAGIGGFDVAAEARGWSTARMVEWDPSCQHWLREHFPGVPVLGDITTVNFKELELVDILCGGFPCPPVSVAGKRLGKIDDRWLWPEFRRAVRDLRPRYVVVENVPGLLITRDDRGQSLAGDVLGDLAALGYDAEWEVLSAGDVGAPQERERVWIVAYASGVERTVAELCEWREDVEDRGGRSVVGYAAREFGETVDRGGAAPSREGSGPGCGALGDPDRPYAQRAGDPGCVSRAPVEGEEPGVAAAGDPVATVGDAGRAGLEELEPPAIAGNSRHVAGERAGVGDAGGGGLGGDARGGPREVPANGRSRLRDWSDGVIITGADGSNRLVPAIAASEGPESPLWPVAARVPGRVARIRAIGNAVVPRVAFEILGIIADREG